MIWVSFAMPAVSVTLDKSQLPRPSIFLSNRKSNFPHKYKSLLNKDFEPSYQLIRCQKEED